ncbi:hypothetical protein JCM14076_13200 [Methylosoma difficile]
MTMDQKAAYLLNAYANDSAVDGGLLFSKALQQAKLDFSDASLARLDNLLSQMREKVKPVKAGFLDDSAKANFALLLAFYLGEFIAKQAGKSVAWMRYDEAVKLLPAEPPLPKDFFTHVLALVGGQVCFPLLVLQSILFDDSPSLSAGRFVEQVVQLIASSNATSSAEWQQDYLHDFLQGKEIPGGVALDDVLRQVGLDFSLDSLKRVDAMLREVRALIAQQDTSYEEFVNYQKTANFILLLASYLGSTTAQAANCSLKWLNHQQTQAMYGDDIGFNFESIHNCALGERIYFPIATLTDVLFAPKPESSCSLFAEKVLASGLPKVVSIYRAAARQPAVAGQNSIAALRQNFQGKIALFVEGINQAGFLAAYGAYMIAEGANLPPTLLQPQGGGQKTLVDLSFYGSLDEANQRGHASLAHNPENAPYLAYMYDGYVNLPKARMDAIVVDLRCYPGSQLSLTIAVPYRPASSPKGFALYSPKLINSDAAERLFPDIFAEFYKGIDSFKNNTFAWDKYLDESI